MAEGWSNPVGGLPRSGTPWALPLVRLTETYHLLCGDGRELLEVDSPHGFG
jgi:hypothetical protein